MQIQDTHPYIRAMEQIKLRVDVIGACATDQVGLTGAARIETAVLQLRMVLELVALASLAANKELFEQQSTRFEKHWHPADIIRDLEKLNPKFYPIPFRTSEMDPQGVKNHVPLSDGFLTKAELIEVHGRCGSLLHARNPFAKPIDYDQFMSNVLLWTNKVVSLLSVHEIWLLGDEHFHVVHMTEDGNESVSMYTFERVGA